MLKSHEILSLRADLMALAFEIRAVDQDADGYPEGLPVNLITVAGRIKALAESDALRSMASSGASRLDDVHGPDGWGLTPKHVLYINGKPSVWGLTVSPSTGLPGFSDDDMAAFGLG